MRFRLLALALMLAAGLFPVAAAEDFTLYELLEPDSHRFAIVYDTTATREGALYYLNPIRVGSVATKESVIELSTGKELKFEVVKGKDAKTDGLVGTRVADDALYLKVHLPGPVPKGGETRIRILKTYTDAASYYLKEGLLIFERPLGIKRNLVVLPKGWELVGNASPGIVSTQPDGRIRVSFLNDRDDQLPVRVTARRLP
jgi:hypothetical protein